MKRSRRGLPLLACILCSTAALAWDGSQNGKLAQADVSAAGTHSFRVMLQGSPALCGNANTWAYVDESDSNYKAFVAALLAAKAQGETVTLYTTRDAVGYCKIGYLATYAG